MKKSSKLTNSNIKIEKKTKKENSYKHYEDYLCTQTFKMKPMSERGLTRLALKVRDWSSSENSLLVEDFLDEMGILPSTYFRWRKKSDKLQKAHELMLRRIASNREIGALKKKLDVSMVKHRQYQFDNRWKEADEFHAALRRKEEEGNTDITIVCAKTPDSKIVSKRNLDEETS